MRLNGLDFLRGLAVILVIFRHGEIDNLIYFVGWLGVDLFFVLSGFLISGLLFKEYLNTGGIKTKRFLIRRGFKIYPPFYFFILFSVVLKYFQTRGFYESNILLSEIFYLQSYFP